MGLAENHAWVQKSSDINILALKVGVIKTSRVFLPLLIFQDRISQDRSWIFQDRSWIFQDRSKWQDWKSIFAKMMVGFGRTELSLRLSSTGFCAISSGHGPRGRGFEGGGETLDFHDFLGGSKMGKQKKKHENAGWTWSDFGLWSSRPAQNDLLKNPKKNNI